MLSACLHNDGRRRRVLLWTRRSRLIFQLYLRCPLELLLLLDLLEHLLRAPKLALALYRRRQQLRRRRRQDWLTMQMHGHLLPIRIILLQQGRIRDAAILLLELLLLYMLLPPPLLLLLLLLQRGGQVPGDNGP